MRELQNAWIHLRFLTEQHREPLRLMAKDDRIWEYTKTLMLTDTYDQQFDKYFGEALSFAAAGGQAYAILEADTQEIIGMTRLYDVDHRVKKGTIGHTWYRPAVWGKVHNKACKLLLLEYCFETLGLGRVDFKVAGHNIRSQKAVVKIGATPEGVLRQYSLRNDGTHTDTHFFSILGSEWPEKKLALEHLVRSHS